MSDDFFGGILDYMRGTVTDASSFFDSATNNAILRGVSGGSTGGPAQGYQNYQKLFEGNRLAEMDNVPDTKTAKQYDPGKFENGKYPAAKAQNYESIEQSWLQRLHRFGQIDESLQSGKVNEGVDR